VRGIFISYRRDDAAGHAGRLFDGLKERFGASRVFMDVTDLRPGQDFMVELERELAKCDYLLAVIGPKWLDAVDATGRRRLDKADDLVRREVSAALAGSATVIPVLVYGARMPSAEALPEGLKPLARRQSIELTDRRWESDLRELVEFLAGKRTAATGPEPFAEARLEAVASGVSVARTSSATRAPGLDPGPVASNAQSDVLSPGTRLLEFEIRDVLGGGGFGIVYRAYDHDLHREVALKEYLPSALARRDGSLRVCVRSQGNADTFAIGLRSFVNEARLLAQFDHPSLVKVYRFWEANGTAYMVMPLYPGRTLSAALKERVHQIDNAWLRLVLADLLDALEVLHARQCLHRDIAPDNILLLEDGRPVLLDFGAARRVIGDSNRALTVIYKPSYAPIEQHSEAGGAKQGPWTDLYALSAVAHFAIVGAPPPSAMSRLVQDTYEPLARRAAGRFDRKLLEGIDLGLRLKPEERPRSVAEMRAALGLAEKTAASALATIAPKVGAHDEPTLVRPRTPARRGRPMIAIAGGALLAAVLAGGIVMWTSGPDGGRAPPRIETQPAHSVAPRMPAAESGTPAPESGLSSAKSDIPPPQSATKPESGTGPQQSVTASPQTANGVRTEAASPRGTSASDAGPPAPNQTSDQTRKAAEAAAEPTASKPSPSNASGSGAPEPASAPREPRKRKDALATTRPATSESKGASADTESSKRGQTGARSSRCSELLLRQSLGEPLSSADLTHLQTQCH
jgi:serine/threonine protein kinase